MFTPNTTLRLRLTIFAAVLLAGCDIPGLGPDQRALQREGDGKAIGGACRHAQRGIEDCYTLNPKASKSAIFTGWKDMDAYMRENKIDGAPSVLGALTNNEKDNKKETEEKPTK